MALSSNSILHFTRSFEYLKGILRENFKLGFCKERIKFVGKERFLMVPMVSFCDIPLSEMKNHISSYGSYGIGMTKGWAKKNHLNPVLYIEDISYLCHSFEAIYQADIIGNKVDFDKWPEHNKQILDILRYIKSYQGDLMRKGKETTLNYRFSDEREWRYVPPIESGFPMAIPAGYFENEKNKEMVALAKEKVSNEFLEFSPNDIKYLIVEKEDEIHPLVQFLNETKGKNYSLHDVQRLTTRIITSEQIKTDF